MLPIFQITPNRVGSGMLINDETYPNDGPSQMRQFVIDSVTCALVLKIIERRTWHD